MRRADGWILLSALSAFLLLSLFFRFSGRIEEIVPLARIRTVPASAIEDGGYLIDLNRADAALLTSLPGIGEELARRIVEYREAEGPLSSPEDLLHVPGIGRGRLAAILPHVTVQ